MSQINEKIRLKALIEPYNINITLCFPTSALVGNIHTFVEETMKKFKLPYKVGRIDWNDAWVPPQYKIGDVFDDKSEIIVYSEDYALTNKCLAGDKADVKLTNLNMEAVNADFLNNQINENFIQKKKNRPKHKKQLLLNKGDKNKEENKNLTNAVIKENDGLNDKKEESKIDKVNDNNKKSKKPHNNGNDMKKQNKEDTSNKTQHNKKKKPEGENEIEMDKDKEKDKQSKERKNEKVENKHYQDESDPSSDSY